MTATRRLTAILAADVAGYSRLMGADEEGTHEGLKAHLRDLIEPRIADHHGRIVKNTGDGFLAEFASVVDAVRCGVEVQRGMAERNGAVPADQRIEFRIGINLGDVIAEGKDIFGDGVNIAARLEALAEPGGVRVSGTVRDHIRDKLPYSFEDCGEQSVKNIARPVRVYALRPEAAARSRGSLVPRARLRPWGGSITAMAGGVSVALLITVAAWWSWTATRSSSTPPTVIAAVIPISKPLVAPRLSIVVLPFANLSNDPDQQNFADAIIEDLTTDLSRISGMVVISRNTAFTYRNKPIDTKQIGRELGVRYVLEGSIRRLGNQVRVNAQLIDAEAGTHLWAERFDNDMADLVGLENAITGRIAHAVGHELVVADAWRPTNQPDALDYILRGRATYSKPASRENYVEALSLFEQALALDPSSVAAQTWLASALVGRVLNGMSDAPDIDLQHADEAITRTLAVWPNNARAHFTEGQVRRAQSRCEEAIPEYERAITLDHNFSSAYAYLGTCKLATGSLDEVISNEEQAIRLNPRDWNLGGWYFTIGAVHLLKGQIDDAIVWLEKSRSANAGFHRTRASLAAAYALKGDTQAAAAELAEARKLNHRYSSIATLKAAAGYLVLEAPKIRGLAEATYFAGLRLAGMPEE